MNNLTANFDRIYINGEWGRKQCSGPGSWHAPLVDAYVDTTVNFLRSVGLRGQCHAIDLGCGDFNIGSKLACACKSIHGIDISKEIVKYCKRKFSTERISFSCNDARTYNFEESDVIFIRQVFQHLSNQDIQLVLDNIAQRTNYLMLTEHIPAGNFTANADIQSGTPHTRLRVGSGVDIMKPPFSHQLEYLQGTLSYFAFGGDIRTTIYRTHRAMAKGKN